MGFLGLSKYIKWNKRLYTSVINTEESVLPVVIDGLNVLYVIARSVLCQGVENALCYDFVKKCTAPFVKYLKQKNMRVMAICFDGMDDPDKIKTFQGRANGTFEINKVFWESNCMDSSGVSILVLSRFYIMKALEELIGYPYEYVLCGVDGDREIAQVCQKYDAYVITNDSDFFVFPVRGMIDSWDIFERCMHETIELVPKKVDVYERSKILSYHHINESAYMLALLIQGNDFVERTNLPPHSSDRRWQTYEEVFGYVRRRLMENPSLQDEDCARIYQMLNKERHGYSSSFYMKNVKKYRIEEYSDYPISFLSDRIDIDNAFDDNIKNQLNESMDAMKQLYDKTCYVVLFGIVFLNPPLLCTGYPTIAEVFTDYTRRIMRLLEVENDARLRVDVKSCAYYPDKSHVERVMNDEEMKIQMLIDRFEKCCELQEDNERKRSRVYELFDIDPVIVRNSLNPFVITLLITQSVIATFDWDDEKRCSIGYAFLVSYFHHDTIHEKEGIESISMEFGESTDRRDIIAFIEVVSIAIKFVTMVFSLLDIPHNNDYALGICAFCMEYAYLKKEDGEIDDKYKKYLEMVLIFVDPKIELNFEGLQQWKGIDLFLNMTTVALDLPELQDRIKRDPEVYKAEFLQQYDQYHIQLQLFKEKPAEPAPRFIALMTFLGHVAQCYPNELSDYPSILFNLMGESADIMSRDVRTSIVKTLILMRNKGLIEVIPLLKGFFHYFRINDKQLRILLYTHIITDISNSNKGKINERLNREIKSYMFDLLNNDSELIARKALDVMVELYRRQIWVDARSVNVIATACLSKHFRVSMGGVRFFLGIESRIEDDEEKEKEIDDEEIDHHSHSRKTKGRERDTKRQIQQRRRKLRQANNKESNPRFPAIALVYDPQGFAEKLLSRLKQSKDDFTYRLLLMDIISRFIGYHKLCIFPYYSFIQSYLTAHQQQITRILVFLVQSCHDYVPPEEIIPIVKCVANNFVSDRSSAEVIALGINTISEVFVRIPLLFEEEEMQPLVMDIIEYKDYKDKGVTIAARNFLNHTREICPAILQKKYRTRGTDKTKRPLAYGEEHVRSYVDNMEALGEAIEKGEIGMNEGEGAWKEEKKEFNDDGDEIKKEKPVKITKELMMEMKKKSERIKDEKEDEALLESGEGEEEEEEEEMEEEEMEEEEEEEEGEEEGEDEKEQTRQRRIALAQEFLSKHVLSPKDYEVLNKSHENNDSSSEDDENADVANEIQYDAVVNPTDLLGYHKKRKETLEERKRKAIEGRQAYKMKLKGGGTTNKEKERKKSFVMVKQSNRVKNKLKLSIHEQMQNTKRQVRRLQVLGKKANKRRRV